MSKEDGMEELSEKGSEGGSRGQRGTASCYQRQDGCMREYRQVQLVAVLTVHVCQWFRRIVTYDG